MKPIALTPYEGEEPYIFVSYAHKDSDIVYPMLEELNRRGYRVWYDEGIAPGNEWPEEIAQHLDGCYLAISMISGRYIESDNCRRELTFALSKRKAFLAVFLEPTELSLGLEMQLSAQLCVLKYNYPSEETFFRKLCSSKDIAVCRGDAFELLNLEDGEGLSDQDRFVASAGKTVEPKSADNPPKRKKPWVAVVAAVALLSFAAVMGAPMIKGYLAQSSIQQSDESGQTEIEFLTGDESSLQINYESVGAETNVSILGVWGEHVDNIGNFVIPESLSGYPVTKIEQYAFTTCLGMTSITLPDSVTSIANFAFYGCADLEQVTLPANLTVISDYVFQGCINLKEITLPNGVVSLGEGAFYGSGLQRVVLPSSMYSIGMYAFTDCTDLQQIIIPDSVCNLSRSAFENCTALKNIVLPSSLNEINFRTFMGCTNLETIRIPRSVAEIGNEAFNGCESLENIYYEGTEAEWKKLISKIDRDYPSTTGKNNQALFEATVHFNS